MFKRERKTPNPESFMTKLDSCTEETVEPTKMPFEYKFLEGESLREIEQYVQETYGQHYVGLADWNQTQVMDLLFANQPTALEFSRGAVIKYVTRYGKKNGYNRKDLLKAAHYILFMLKSDTDMRN